VQHFRLDFGWNHHNLVKICSNGWKMVKLDGNFGDKKMSFWKKIAKINIFEKKIHHLTIFRPLKKHWLDGDLVQYLRLQWYMYQSPDYPAQACVVMRYSYGWDWVLGEPFWGKQIFLWCLCQLNGVVWAFTPFLFAYTFSSANNSTHFNKS
jgi:hypothetical protein